MKRLITSAVILTAILSAGAQTSPYKGVAIDEIADGTSYYLYNVDFGKWLGDNNRNKGYGWTSHAELVAHGRDIKFIANGEGWQLDPKLGSNHSINAVGLYMDTGRNKSTWKISPASYGEVSNAVTITGEVVWDNNELRTGNLAANDAGDMDEAKDIHNVWQIVTREEILEYAIENGSEENPVNISGLVLGGTFPVADDHRTTTWQGDITGSQASGGDGHYHCNRVWELWGITNRNVYQDIELPNGKYRVGAKAIYVSSANDGVSAEHYNRYLDGTEPTLGYIYANDGQSVMVNAYSLVTDGRVADHNTKDLGNGKWMLNGTNEYSTNMFEGKGEVTPIDVTVTTGRLRVGFKVEGATNAWMLINNIDLYCLGKVADIAPYKEALANAIEKANAYDGETTVILADQLAQALADANAVTESTDIDELSAAAAALEGALTAAKEVDVRILRPTAVLAAAEGIDVAEINDYLINGATNRVDELLRLVRNQRKLNAAVRTDVSKVQGSEPDAGEFYLLNVGTGLYFDITADWSTHVSIDNPGLLLQLEKGGMEGIDNRQVYYIHGGGFNGFNWQEEYFDKNGEHKFHFVPVEGKDKVYYLNVFDNYDWHFIYDVREDVCDDNTHYWNAVQKRNNNTYKDDLNAQWMLVTPAQRTAMLQKATVEDPVDATHLINNPNFTFCNPENITRGWTGAGAVCSADRRAWYVLEWYMRDANMKQTITGLPAGKYQVSATAFFRDGSADNEAAKVGNNQALNQLASLVAINGSEDRVSSLLPNVTSEAGNMPGIGESREGVDGEFVIWPWQAQEYFQTGLYKVTTPVIEVGPDGTLTIGIEMADDGTDGNWVVADNFRLTCLGTADIAEVGTAGYATYVAPFNIAEIPAGVEAFAAQNRTSYVHLEPLTEIPAGEAVVLKAEEGRYPFYGASSASISVENDLVAATEDIEADGTQYVLADASEGVGFYRVSEGIIAKGKGYLMGKTASARVLRFDNETGIADIENADDNDGQVIYNLSGQRMGKLQKGVNIVDGKKCLY